MIQTADLILVTGSFAVAGEAKRLLAQKKQAARVEVKGTPGRVPR
jgi:hypothetical protein